MSLSPVLLGSSDTYDHVRSPHAECQFRTKPMDRTPDWQGAVLSCGVRLELSQEQLLQLKSGALLRARSREPGAFGKAARTVGASIDSLRDFIRLHQKDYLSDRAYSEADKDKIEVEVGLFVKTCTQQVEANGESHVRTAPAINEQTAAHLHGVVLSLAEQLHSASSRFDQCRAARYQQLADRESARALLHRHQQRHTDQQQQQQQRQQQRQWGGEVQGQGPGVSSTQPEHQGRASPLHWEGPEEREGQQPLPLGASFQALEQLSSKGRAVLQVERTVRELATLNTLFSTAVLHQAEAIEAIYTASVEASQHLKLGNSELRKTMAVNNSSQRYILALLLAATLGLLFFDWFNS
ncbi:hypothetical protein V8C86DRAFT_883891 [Haematococcus lacustris]